jgi:S1-C subfamily serine protease
MNAPCATIQAGPTFVENKVMATFRCARALFTGWLIGGSVSLSVATSDSAAQEIPSNVRAVVEAAIGKMRPSLVRIHVVSTEYREGREMKMQAVGSGAIISKDGYLVTNHHVAGHGARMVCTLWNREGN